MSMHRELQPGCPSAGGLVFPPIPCSDLDHITIEVLLHIEINDNAARYLTVLELLDRLVPF